eukprot:GFYU01001216.1.p1 GENE.GFYU01001216.1~~GFYU01001216.1.p1  ORF type:complete len:374 (+),score=89.05 GFYU01001216.1:127-1122(+)
MGHNSADSSPVRHSPLNHQMSLQFGANALATSTAPSTRPAAAPMTTVKTEGGTPAPTKGGGVWQEYEGVRVIHETIISKKGEITRKGGPQGPFEVLYNNGQCEYFFQSDLDVTLFRMCHCLGECGKIHGDSSESRCSNKCPHKSRYCAGCKTAKSRRSRRERDPMAGTSGLTPAFAKPNIKRMKSTGNLHSEPSTSMSPMSPSLRGSDSATGATDGMQQRPRFSVTHPSTTQLDSQLNNMSLPSTGSDQSSERMSMDDSALPSYLTNATFSDNHRHSLPPLTEFQPTEYLVVSNRREERRSHSDPEVRSMDALLNNYDTTLDIEMKQEHYM